MKPHGSGILDAELLWYFNESAGELGIRASSLEPSVQQGADGEPSERQVEAAARHRRVSSALYSLTHDHQRTLKLAHEPLPVALRPSLCKLGPVAAVTLMVAGNPWAHFDEADPRAAIFRSVGSPHAVVERLQGRSADEVAGKLVAAAEVVIFGALAAYREARKTVGELEKSSRQLRHNEFMRRLRDGRTTHAGVRLHAEIDRASTAHLRPRTALVDRPGRAGLWPLAKGVA